MNTRMFHFDFLRALAILFIVLSHLPEYIYYNQGILVFTPYFAIFGMALFVFISGYLIYENNRRIHSYRDILAFYKKRVLRLFPIYWSAIVLYYIVFAILVPRYAPGQFHYDVSQLYGLNNLLVHLAGLQIILSPGYAIPLPTLWFVGLIFLFYLIYPFLMYCTKRCRDLVIMSAGIVIAFSLLRFLFNVIDDRFFNYFLVFIAGIVCCSLSVLQNERYSKIVLFAPIVMVCALLFDVRVTSLIHIENYSAASAFLYNIFLYDSPVLMISFSLTLLWFAESFLGNLSGTGTKMIGFFSTSSYPVFLYHTPVLLAAYGVIWFLDLQGIAGDILIIVITLPLLFLFSYYIQKWEIRLRTKYFPPPITHNTF